MSLFILYLNPKLYWKPLHNYIIFNIETQAHNAHEVVPDSSFTENHLR